MEQVQVTVTANHYGKDRMYHTGDTYETSKRNASLLKGKGLVEYEGEAVVERGPQILTGYKSDTGLTTTAIVEQGSGKEGDLVGVDKKDLSRAKAFDKVKSVKKKEKVEGEFPGSSETQTTEVTSTNAEIVTE